MEESQGGGIAIDFNGGEFIAPQWACLPANGPYAFFVLLIGVCGLTLLQKFKQMFPQF